MTHANHTRRAAFRSPDRTVVTIGLVSADALRSAYDALVHGDAEPLVALMDDELLWTGRSSSPWRFWRPAPS